MSLLFGNVSEDDILLQKQLEAMVNSHPDRWAGWWGVGISWRYGCGT